MRALQDIAGGPLLGQNSGLVEIRELHPDSSTPPGWLRRDHASSPPRGLIPLPPRLTYPTSSLKKRGPTVQTPVGARQGEETVRVMSRNDGLERGREPFKDYSLDCGRESPENDSPENSRQPPNDCSRAGRRKTTEDADLDVGVRTPRSCSPDHMREGESARCSVRLTRTGGRGDRHGSEAGVRTSGPNAGPSTIAPSLQTAETQGGTGLPGMGQWEHNISVQEGSVPSPPASSADCAMTKAPATGMGCGSVPLAMLLSPAHLAFMGRVVDSMISQLPCNPGSLPNSGPERVVSPTRRSSRGKTHGSPVCPPINGALQPTAGEQSAADAHVDFRSAPGNGAKTKGQPRDLLVVAGNNGDAGRIRQRGSADGMPGPKCFPAGDSVGLSAPGKGGSSSDARSHNLAGVVPSVEAVLKNSCALAEESPQAGSAQVPLSEETGTGKGVSTGSLELPEGVVCKPPLPVAATRNVHECSRAQATPAVQSGSAGAAGGSCDNVAGCLAERATASKAPTQPHTTAAQPSKPSGSSRRRTRSSRGGPHGDSPIALQGPGPPGTSPAPVAAAHDCAALPLPAPLAQGPPHGGPDPVDTLVPAAAACGRYAADLPPTRPVGRLSQAQRALETETAHVPAAGGGGGARLPTSADQSPPQVPSSPVPDVRQLRSAGVGMQSAAVGCLTDTPLQLSTVSDLSHTQLQGASAAVAAATLGGAPSLPTATVPALRQPSHVLGSSAPSTAAASLGGSPASSIAMAQIAMAPALSYASGLPGASAAPAAAATLGGALSLPRPTVPSLPLASRSSGASAPPTSAATLASGLPGVSMLRAATLGGAPSLPTATVSALHHASGFSGTSAPPRPAPAPARTPTHSAATVPALPHASGTPRASAPGGATKRGIPLRTPTVPSPREAPGSLGTPGASALSNAAAKRAPHSPTPTGSPPLQAAGDLGTSAQRVAQTTPRAAPSSPVPPVSTVRPALGTPGVSATSVVDGEAGRECSLPGADAASPPQAPGSRGPAPGRASVDRMNKQKGTRKAVAAGDGTAKAR